MSLLCRLKNLVHKGILKEKDLDRIVIIPKEQELCEDCISRSHFDERVRVAGGMVEYEVSDDFKDGVLTVLEMLKTEPSIQPKPKTDVFEKIRAEIMDFEEELFHRPNTDYTDYAAVRHCVEIIDKYKAESEE